MPKQNLRNFIEEWEQDYKKQAVCIPLFSPVVTARWTKKQKKLFVRLFYHARGHFYRFLWIMATQAPSAPYRTVVVQNINEELGVVDVSHAPHEQLFLEFAETLDLGIRNEIKTETNYLPFLKAFDQGHADALLNGNWNQKWALFSAYELLDDTDYNNLYALAKSIGASGSALTFFNVHRRGDHFSATLKLLEGVWSTNPKAVVDGFTFIGNHQLNMWRTLSKKVQQAST